MSMISISNAARVKNALEYKRGLVRKKTEEILSRSRDNTIERGKSRKVFREKLLGFKNLGKEG